MLVLASTIEKAFEANKSQNEALRTFLDSFNTTEAPTIREFDEEEAESRYYKKLMHDQAPDILDRIGQFDLMLKEMDRE